MFFSSTYTGPLRKIAYARSGDKGSSVNIGVIAIDPNDYPFLAERLTEERVARFFKTLNPRAVRRYLLPNLHALNFILEGVLPGGGSLNLRVDAQGKTLGQALLELSLEEL